MKRRYAMLLVIVLALSLCLPRQVMAWTNSDGETFYALDVFGSRESLETTREGDFLYGKSKANNGAAVICWYFGSSASFKIPAEIGGCRVEGLSENSFVFSGGAGFGPIISVGDRNIKEVIIPCSVQKIGFGALRLLGNTNVRKIIVPSSVTSIDDAAFFENNNNYLYTVYCSKGSAMYNYAVKNKIPYEIVDEGSLSSHDLDGTGKCRVCGMTFSTAVDPGDTDDPGDSENPGDTDDPGEQETPADHEHQYVTKEVVRKATPLLYGEKKEVCTVEGCGRERTVLIYRPDKVSLSSEKYTWDGKAHKPSAEVTDSEGEIISSDNYSLSYGSNGKTVGIYTVTVEFKGDFYAGTMSKKVTIRPKGTTIKKIEKAGKKLKVTWKKQAKQTSGYMVEYSTNKQFVGETTNNVLIKKAKSTSGYIKWMKPKTTYYVRIRTYKTVSDDGKTKKIYSPWSKAKKVKSPAGAELGWVL